MDRIAKPRFAWSPYAVASLAVIFAAAVRAALSPALGTEAAYITFYPAVMLAAFYGGLRAGLVSAAFSVAVAAYWLDLSGFDASDWASTAIFIVSSGLISWIARAMRRAQARAAAAETEARIVVERQQAARALESTEERARFLAQIIERAEQPVGVGFPDGRLGTCNPAYCELTGYTAEELEGVSWAHMLTPPEWLDTEMAALAELERTGKPVRYQKEYIRKDGRRVPVEMLVHVLRDAAGRAQHYYAFVTDISERKRGEEELRRQREWLRVTLSSIGDAVLATDTKGAITFLNPVAAGLTGWTEAEALGRPVGEIFQVVDEQTRERSDDLVACVLREGRVAVLNSHAALVARDGSLMPIEDSAAPIRDSDGSLTGVVVVFHDVSEKRRAQETLENSEARLRTILENLMEGIVVATLEGHVFLWNRAALDMHGFASLEECRRRLPEFVEWFELSTMDGAILPVEEWPLARILRGERWNDLEIQVRSLRHGWRRVFNYGGALVRDAEGRPLLAMVSISDITARKKAEQALRESEAAVRSVGDNLPEGAVYRYRQDADGRVRFEFISAGIERLTGVTPAEAVADAGALRAAVLREDLEPLLAAEQVSRERLTPFEMELRHVHRVTGEIRWSLLRSAPRRRSDGVTVWDGVQFDITERKRLEEQLRERAEELETVMEVAPVAIWVAHDAQCHEIDGNRMANAFYEADAGENVSANITPVRRFFQHDRELAPEELPMQEAAARGVEVRNAELGVLLPSGRRIHMLGHASPLRDDAGRVRGCVGAFLDITERKLAEQALGRSEASYRAIARNIPDGAVAVVDTGLRYSVIEGSLLARLGLRREQIEGRAVAEVAEDPHGGQVSANYYGRALAGEPVDTEVAYRGRDLAIRYVPLRDERVSVVGAMALWLDITEGKRKEEQLRQTQRLESIGLLAGGVAHDFNNLLTGIMGQASLLLNDASPDMAGALKEIIEGTERAAHLTRQLLAYSGKGQFLVRDLHLTRAVREMADLLRLSIPKSVELRLDLCERLPSIAMDPGHLKQAVVNLVINAGEAIGEGNSGRLSVATGVQEIDCPFVDALGGEVRAGRRVYLEVSDTGSGMDPETIERIFDPFFTTKFTGRGLGLAAVSGIVRSQHGAITVKSVPGGGSTFRVLFPPQADRDTVEPSTPPVATVLVVDDEEAVRKFVAAALRRSGYRVWQAGNGREAVAICDRETERLDAVILDVVMPVMGGCESLPELTRRRPNMKVLLTSGYDEAEAKRLCASYEGAAFIQKPYTAQTLMQSVEDLLRGG